jgi:hypothetical protein
VTLDLGRSAVKTRDIASRQRAFPLRKAPRPRRVLAKRASGWPYRQLLDSAARFEREGYYAVAVVVAQAACELVAKPVDELLPNDHLANQRVGNFYVASTGDPRRTLLEALKPHAKRRHGIVHGSKRETTEQEADASLRAATALADDRRAR